MGPGVARIDLDGPPRGGERRRKGDCRVRTAANHRKLASPSQVGPGAGEIWVGSNCPLKQFDSILVAFLSQPRMLAVAGKVEFVSGEIFRTRTPRGCLLGFADHAAAAETVPQLIGDVALHGEEVLRWLVPALRPQMRIARRIDQL